jgi:hypothetical protein
VAPIDNFSRSLAAAGLPSVRCRSLISEGGASCRVSNLPSYLSGRHSDRCPAAKLSGREAPWGGGVPVQGRGFKGAWLNDTGHSPGTSAHYLLPLQAQQAVARWVAGELRY